MRILLMLMFVLGASAFAAENPSPKDPVPSEINEYEWKAKSVDEDLCLKGAGKSTRVHLAYRQVQLILNDLAQQGTIKDNSVFRVNLVWKGKMFSRVLRANSGKYRDPIPPRRIR